VHTKPKKIVVSDGSGFIGAYFCQLPKERGDEVVILDIIEPSEKIHHGTFRVISEMQPNHQKKYFISEGTKSCCVAYT